jgi:hypothetical protein
VLDGGFVVVVAAVVDVAVVDVVVAVVVTTTDDIAVVAIVVAVVVFELVKVVFDVLEPQALPVINSPAKITIGTKSKTFFNAKPPSKCKSVNNTILQPLGIQSVGYFCMPAIALLLPTISGRNIPSSNIRIPLVNAKYQQSLIPAVAMIWFSPAYSVN